MYPHFFCKLCFLSNPTNKNIIESDGSFSVIIQNSTYVHMNPFLTMIILSYSNIYPTRCNVTQFILSGNRSTCFGRYHHPSSGAQTTVSTASGICHNVTANCRYRGGVPTLPRQQAGSSNGATNTRCCR